MRRFDVLLVAAVVAGACADQSTGFREHQAAFLRRSTTDSIDFTVPDTVALATNFNVSVTTYGGPCDVKGASNLFGVSPDSAVFVPVNVTETRDGVCPTQDLGLTRTFPHSGTLQFTQAGPATVVVVGRDVNGSEMIRGRDVFVRQP